jgi:hypothetical protein
MPGARPSPGNGMPWSRVAGSGDLVGCRRGVQLTLEARYQADGSNALNSMVPFVPPKPNEFDMAVLTSAFLAVLGT